LGEKTPAEAAFEQRMTFIQIPGPNPILRHAGDPALWDGVIIEACNVLKDGETYYLYYHGAPGNKEKWPRIGYRIGVATAPHPMGPWTKFEGNPILDLGAEDSWECEHVACAAVLKEKDGIFYMWYSGRGKGPWSIGLATAESPLGPWKKHDANPIIGDFGYMGGVVKVDGKYRVYVEHPIGDSSPDQGPIALAVADKPEGPYEKYKGNPVLPAGEMGSWDDGGFSEGGILHHEGMYHLFAGGTKAEKLESISYAYSFDGINFTKYGKNPIAARENNPDASAFAEPHALWEPPFLYLYHTLRYTSAGSFDPEDIGVQAMATRKPFKLVMPIPFPTEVAGGASTNLKECPPISLRPITTAALTVEYKAGKGAKRGIRLHVRESTDGMKFDTEDAMCFELAPRADESVARTVGIETKAAFAKAMVENLDDNPVTDVKLTATVGAG